MFNLLTTYNMKKNLVFAGVAALMLLFSCNKNDTQSNMSDNNPSNADAGFMQMAAYGNMDEISLGNLASTKATDAPVKEFGMMMATDHLHSEDELNVLAKNKGVTLPGNPDQAHQDMKAQLEKLSGRAFDSTYIHAQVNDHKNTVTLFQAEISDGKDQDVKNFAAKYLPIIQQHLHKADSLAKKF
jgi:putative membrane protein